MDSVAPITAAWRTDPGLVRGHNEDFVVAREPADTEDERRNGWLYVVADGVGGADAGEVASEYATRQTVAHYVAGGEQGDWGERLLEAMQAANTDLRRLALERNDSRRMATTMVAALIQGNKVFIGNVGDSRAYLWRDAVLEQVTRDQSLVARLVEEGAITEDEAAHHPHKNIILYSIGTERRPPIDLFERSFQPGDVLLLCSDGLTRHVADAEISAILGRQAISGAADALVQLARERGGEDNISVVLVRNERRAATTATTARVAVGRAPQPPGTAAAVLVEDTPNLLRFTFFLSAVMVVLIFLLWLVIRQATTV